MAKTDAQFNHRIPEKLKKEFEEEAKKEGRSVTQHLIHILQERNNKITLSDKLDEFIANQEIFNNALLTAIKNPKVNTSSETASREKKPLINTRIFGDNLKLHLSKTTVTALNKNDVRIVRDLVNTSSSETKKWIGVGKVKLEEINKFMLSHGLHFINM